MLNIDKKNALTNYFRVRESQLQEAPYHDSFTIIMEHEDQHYFVLTEDERLKEFIDNISYANLSDLDLIAYSNNKITQDALDKVKFYISDQKIQNELKKVLIELTIGQETFAKNMIEKTGAGSLGGYDGYEHKLKDNLYAYRYE